MEPITVKEVPVESKGLVGAIIKICVNSGIWVPDDINLSWFPGKFNFSFWNSETNKSNRLVLKTFFTVKEAIINAREQAAKEAENRFLRDQLMIMFTEKEYEDEDEILH